MTTVTLYEKEGKVVSFKVEGHAGAAQSGKDIVCAAISALTQTAILGLIQVAGIKVSYHRDDYKGRLWAELPEELTPEQRRDADIILGTMADGLKDIATGYPKYIKTEVSTCL